MRDVAPRRWQTGALTSYATPRWGELSAPDAAALVAYTDGESSAACAIARELPRARDRAADATYRRALALWCAGAAEGDLRAAALAHVDALAEALRGAKPAVVRDTRACVRWCQAALLTAMTDVAPADAALLDTGGALLAGDGPDDEWRYGVALVRAVLAGAQLPPAEGVRFSPGAPAASIARRDPEALARGVEADLAVLTRLLARQRRAADPATLAGRTTGYVQRGELWLRTGWLALGRRAGLDVPAVESPG